MDCNCGRSNRRKTFAAARKNLRCGSTKGTVPSPLPECPKGSVLLSFEGRRYRPVQSPQRKIIPILFYVRVPLFVPGNRIIGGALTAVRGGDHPAATQVLYCLALMNKTPEDPKDASNTMKQFVVLLAANQQRLYAYVFALVPDYNEAEELVQSTSAILWKKFDQFTPGTNFGAWAMRIARNEVLAYFRQQKTARMRFSEVAVECLSDDLDAMGNEVDERFEALALCLEKLPERHRNIVRLRYKEGVSAKEVAQHKGRSVSAIFKTLNRLHRTLFDCIQSQLGVGKGESS